MSDTEVQENIHTFEFDGETYTVDIENADDVDVLEAREDAKFATLARLLLGNDQYYGKFKTKKRKTEELFQLCLLALNLETSN